MQKNCLEMSVNRYVGEDGVELRRRCTLLEGGNLGTLYFKYTSELLHKLESPKTPAVYQDRGSSEHET